MRLTAAQQDALRREQRIVYTKGMAAACRLILEDARLPRSVRDDIEERLSAYTDLIVDLGGKR